MTTHFRNGCRKIEPVAKSNVSWYPEKQEDVIGIDFGTSTLALAYKVNGKVEKLIIQEECVDAYVPTVLLVTENGQIEIGNRALQRYCRLENIDVENCLFFERVKLQLQQDKIVSLRTTIEGSDGKDYYVVEVIAFILREVRRRLATYFKKRGGKYSVSDFHWVLTVPAIWGQKARDMMREAAYMAGLCSDIRKWDEMLSLPLKPSGTHLVTSVKQFESCPERLSLVYEPDAAAAWCKQLSEHDVKTIDDQEVMNDSVTTKHFFLTIDVGGGTIDVTAHQVLEQGRMKRINIPHGEVYGGTIINQAFQNFLEKEVVQDNRFSEYLSGPELAENKAELLGLVYCEFEKTKKVFAEKTILLESDAFMVQLPFSFASTYQSCLKQFPVNLSIGDVVAYKKRTQMLQISAEKMSSFFAENIRKLHQCISRARDAVIEEFGDKFEIFYLVGGFGGCKRISDEIRRKYGSRNLNVIVPQQHDLAVVKGACIYYDHQILMASDATYGIAIALKYDADNPVHAKGQIVYDDDGVKYCNHVFQPIVQIGQELLDGEVYLHQLTPFSERNKQVAISVYCSEAEHVSFTNGEDGCELKHAATLTIDITEGMHLPCSERLINILFDFNGIEIKIFARFRETQKRINASIDFLSTLNKFDNTCI